MISLNGYFFLPPSFPPGRDKQTAEHRVSVDIRLGNDRDVFAIASRRTLPVTCHQARHIGLSVMSSSVRRAGAPFAGALVFPSLTDGRGMSKGGYRLSRSRVGPVGRDGFANLLRRAGIWPDRRGLLLTV